jgi:uncharacterized membrane protein YphA (DoxX/SURF4 family)
MSKASFHILRVGTAITFLWIGILILKNPDAWGGFIQPWAEKLLPMPIHEMMIGTAYLDLAIGFFLLIDTFVWLAAFVGAGHMLIVLAVSGINDVTVRDIAILAGTIALFADSIPDWTRSKFRKNSTPQVP